MDIEKIFAMIILAFTLLSLLVLLIVAVALTYKSEKEFKQLRNDELKTRIELYDAIKDYIYRGK